MARPLTYKKTKIKEVLVEAARARLDPDRKIIDVLREHGISERLFEQWEARYGIAGKDMEW